MKEQFITNAIDFPVRAQFQLEIEFHPISTVSVEQIMNIVTQAIFEKLAHAWERMTSLSLGDSRPYNIVEPTVNIKSMVCLVCR